MVVCLSCGFEPPTQTPIRVGDRTEVDGWYRDQAGWAKKAMLNTALMGKFTSDRSIEDYVEKVWKLNSCTITQQ